MTEYGDDARRSRSSFAARPAPGADLPRRKAFHSSLVTPFMDLSTVSVYHTRLSHVRAMAWPRNAGLTAASGVSDHQRPQRRGSANGRTSPALNRGTRASVIERLVAAALAAAERHVQVSSPALCPV